MDTDTAIANPLRLPSGLRSALATLMLCGATLIGVAWYGATGTLLVENQTRWCALALAGTLSWTAACAAAATRLRRQVSRRRVDRLQQFDVLLSAGAPLATVPTLRPGSPDLVAAAGMRRYHGPGCPLVEGKAVQRASRDDHESAGRRACQVCEA